MSEYEHQIIQIMPAPAGMRAVYFDNGIEIFSPILCLGLTKSGMVVALDFSTDGVFIAAANGTNFKRFEWNGK